MKNLLNLYRTVNILIILVFASFSLHSQKITNSKVTYDTNFNPTLTVAINNPTNKTITSAQIIIYTQMKGTRNNDISGSKNETKTVQITVPPYQTKTVSISFSLKNYYVYNGCVLKSVRFSDGSIR